jgi:hypothetical protein
MTNNPRNLPLHTGKVVGSIPTSPTIIASTYAHQRAERSTNAHQKLVRNWCAVFRQRSHLWSKQ